MAINSTITPISSTQITSQMDYSPRDTTLINAIGLETTLDPTSYIEYSIYNLSNNLLFNTYTYSSYTVKNDGQSALNSEVSLSKISNLNVSRISPESTPESYLNKFVKKISLPSIKDQVIGDLPLPNGKSIELPCIPKQPIDIESRISPGIILCHPMTNAISIFNFLI